MKKIIFLASFVILSFGVVFSQTRLNEGFEGNVFPPEDWTIIEKDGDGYNWMQRDSSSFIVHSGAKCAGSYSWYANTTLTPNNYLITPQLSVVAGDSLKWWIATSDPNNPAEKYSIKVSTTLPVVDSFKTTVFEETLTKADNKFGERKINLSQYAGQKIYVAFVHNGSKNLFMIKLDDVSGPEIFKFNIDAKLTIDSVYGNVTYMTPINHIKMKEGVVAVRNKGLTAITNSFDLNYQLLHNNSEVINSIKNFAPNTGSLLYNSTLTSTFPSDYSINNYNQSGIYTHKLWIDVNGDEDRTNDTAIIYTQVITDTVFAADNGTFVDALRLTIPHAIGNIYTLNEKDTLTSMTIAFPKLYTNLDFEIVVYEILNDSVVEPICSTPVTRTVDMSEKFVTFSINPRILEAGSYIFAANQLTRNSIAPGYDADPEGAFYIIENGFYDRVAMPKYGNIIIRANFGHNPVIINNDIVIANTEVDYPRLIPFNHMNKEGITAQARNLGLNNATNVKLVVKEGENILSESDVYPTLEPEKFSSNFKLKTPLNITKTGDIDLSLTVISDETDEVLGNNTYTFTHIVTDTVFATDVDTIKSGLRIENPDIIGNIYTFVEADTLTSVSVGFSRDTTINENAFIMIYKVTNDSILTEVLKEPFVRRKDMAMKINTIPLRYPRILEPGKYLFAVSQINDISLGVACDRNSRGYYWVVRNGKCYKYMNTEDPIGNLIIRANVGNNAVIIQKDVEILSFKKPASEIESLTSTQEIIVEVKNRGSASVTNLPVHCKVNGTELPIQTITSMEPYAAANVTFIADMSAKIEYTIVAYTSLEGDEIKNNDTSSITVKNSALFWNFNQGMPTTFKTKRYDNAVVVSNIADVYPQNDAWAIMEDFSSKDQSLCATSPSWFKTYTRANRWMITPYVELISGNSINWDARASAYGIEGYDDGYQIRISVSETFDTSSFSTVIYSTDKENKRWVSHNVDLSAYAGKKVAFAFIQNTLGGLGIQIDNICILGDLATGIETLNSEDINIAVFPNPAKNYTDIQASSKINSIKVINVAGQVIRSIEGVGGLQYTLNTSDINAGVYILMINTDRGQKTNKLIISK